MAKEQKGYLVICCMGGKPTKHIHIYIPSILRFLAPFLRKILIVVSQDETPDKWEGT